MPSEEISPNTTIPCSAGSSGGRHCNGTNARTKRLNFYGVPAQYRGGTEHASGRVTGNKIYYEPEIIRTAKHARMHACTLKIELPRRIGQGRAGRGIDGERSPLPT